MAESKRYSLNGQLDIEQILLEAQHRWLRPLEICEILQNHQKFRISPEPPNRPPSGSLFLFDRKALRYFRKDGHSWRKKRDGKIVKEAHERLKAGSIDVLHCYYAHGEENENFQRRCYWMLEEEMLHIVLVHYRDVKGNRTNFNRVIEPREASPDFQEAEDLAISEMDSPVSSKSHPYDYQVNSQVTDTTSLNRTQPSEYEDVESVTPVYNQQSTTGFHSSHDVQPSMMQKAGSGSAVPYFPIPFSNEHQVQFSGNSDINQGRWTENKATTYVPNIHLDFSSWENISLQNPATYQSSLPSSQSGAKSLMHGQANATMGQVSENDFKRQVIGNRADGLEDWQTHQGDSSHLSMWSMDQNLNPDLEFDTLPAELAKHPICDDLQPQLPDADGGGSLEAKSDCNLSVGVKTEYSAIKQPLLDGVLRAGLKKLDSFDRWISTELEDVSDLHTQSNSQTYWDNVRDEDGVHHSSIASQVPLDTYILSPSLSQDQFFSITDFSPNWAFAGAEIKVLITGKFLKSQQELETHSWACMFGELEVPAEVLGDGVLCCYTPVEKVGRVPFYITCSNRLACSEVREFEFRVTEVQDIDFANVNSCTASGSPLHIRFGNFLFLESVGSQNSSPSNEDFSQLCSKITSLLTEDNNEREEMLHLPFENEFMAEKLGEHLLQKLLREKLCMWLLQKVTEGGKGPNVLDEGGQGILHFAAALGYDWAIPPTIAAGVSINFRDVNGWTALHWAASYGREQTVGFLISLGASPGTLTDPTPRHPSGRTPADLASSNGHKGIAGYLAESALSSHLSSLELNENKEGDNGQVERKQGVETVSERAATPVQEGEWPHGLSLKDSLAAVRNATQAAARIHQVFRVQSFQRKQLKEYGGSEIGLSDERALSRLTMKTNRAGQHDELVSAAATRIQNRFRSWKGRKEFLLIRKRIIKIQAHVRGHQVRKNCRNITWSVGILEKVILRWRRKGSGLRGFKPESLPEGTSSQDFLVPEDDDDVLREGRKQTEKRLQKALARVKSMVQYPEARDQYRRLLNVVSGMQETKTMYDIVPSNSVEAADFDGDLFDLDELLDDDTFMLIG